MFDYILDFQFNSRLAIILYWIPLFFCIFGYTMRSAKNYIKDKEEREKDKHYYVPTDTVGDLVGRFLISLVPIFNLIAAMFDLSPEVFSSFFRFINKFLDIPLVPKRKDTSK